MRTSRMKLVGLAMIVGLIMPGLVVTNVLAAEIIVKEVAVQRVRMVKEVVKTADNFVILFDASGSMQDLYKDTNMKKIDLAEAMFKGRALTSPGAGLERRLVFVHPVESFLRDGAI